METDALFNSLPSVALCLPISWSDSPSIRTPSFSPYRDATLPRLAISKKGLPLRKTCPRSWCAVQTSSLVDGPEEQAVTLANTATESQRMEAQVQRLHFFVFLRAGKDTMLLPQSVCMRGRLCISLSKNGPRSLSVAYMENGRHFSAPARRRSLVSEIRPTKANAAPRNPNANQTNVPRAPT
jgi:hypothetical protein